eukprot:TRINITY_DN12412_c0_g1_i2.p1 TRINITY_DN12412_c0_g1~~TRINITY_DN12412_c0_g1_i2.p1  ORF type:complete len:202 (+),score=-0.79 TRINITY_DN12412_c0_g1_i2:203-808(+)
MNIKNGSIRQPQPQSQQQLINKQRQNIRVQYKSVGLMNQNIAKIQAKNFPYKSVGLINQNIAKIQAKKFPYKSDGLINQNIAKIQAKKFPYTKLHPPNFESVVLINQNINQIQSKKFHITKLHPQPLSHKPQIQTLKKKDRNPKSLLFQLKILQIVHYFSFTKITKFQLLNVNYYFLFHRKILQFVDYWFSFHTQLQNSLH